MVIITDSSTMEIVLETQAEGCEVRKGGDILTGYLSLDGLCLVGYDFTIKFEG
jgi:hypothetical protein